jgi:hypothetical protein
MNKMAKLIAIICCLCISINAATINVAAGASIAAAVKNAAAKDTIKIAAGTFIEPNIVIDKALTVIGFDKDSTIIKRADKDSIKAATIKVAAKFVTLKKLFVFGHFAYRWGDSTMASINQCYPSTNAVEVAGADSSSIIECNMSAGDGTDWRTLEAASGSIGLLIKKSKRVYLLHDSIQGGMNERTGQIGYDTLDADTGTGKVLNPLFTTGEPGVGLYIDSSSFFFAESTYVMGGEGKGMNYKGFGQTAAIGTYLRAVDSAKFNFCTLYQGRSYLGIWDTSSVYAVKCTLATSVKIFKCVQLEFRRYKAETGCKVEYTDPDPIGVLSLPSCFTAKNVFTIQYGPRALTFGCLLKKASYVAIDLLNAKGQAIRHVRTDWAQPGMRQFSIDNSALAASAYFLRVATNESSKSFRLPVVR